MINRAASVSYVMLYASCGTNSMLHAMARCSGPYRLDEKALQEHVCADGLRRKRHQGLASHRSPYEDVPAGAMQQCIHPHSRRAWSKRASGGAAVMRVSLSSELTHSRRCSDARRAQSRASSSRVCPCALGATEPCRRAPNRHPRPAPVSRYTMLHRSKSCCSAAQDAAALQPSACTAESAVLAHAGSLHRLVRRNGYRSALLTLQAVRLSVDP